MMNEMFLLFKEACNFGLTAQNLTKLLVCCSGLLLSIASNIIMVGVCTELCIFVNKQSSVGAKRSQETQCTSLLALCLILY